ncbi:MAG TPA: hypothetical protein PLP66_02285 [Phycisphaerae bacterium]|nr:hypothetical protein [Phycisphaerae bacterium]HQL55820.1 hypothetical protein [Phycisphaerae bacterium]
MQFIKTHWMLLASGVVALAAIAVTVLGMTSDAVIKEMEQRKQAASEISTLRSAPQNEETINAEKERGHKFEQEYKTVVETAERINKREPLIEGAFPKPAQLETQYRFKQTYARAIWDLPRSLKAGTLPTDQDLADEAEIMADMQKRKSELEGETPAPTAEPWARPPVQPLTPQPLAPVPSGRTGRGVRGPRGGPTGGQVPTEAGAALQPAAMPTGVAGEEVRRRAAIKKARNIRIYADPQTSFHVSPIADADAAPTPAEMWYAQVSLWIQQDLVDAIAKVNDAAAQQLGPSEASVAQMPVKRIEQIMVHGYILNGGVVVPFTAGTARPGAAGAQVATLTSFTNRVCDEQFDVVRVTLTVIVDQRELLRLIDAIARTNFYQLVGAEYTVVDSVDPAGYLYGQAPLVRAALDFEGYMARKIYKSMMPAEVLQVLGAAPAAGANP